MSVSYNVWKISFPIRYNLWKDEYHEQSRLTRKRRKQQGTNWSYGLKLARIVEKVKRKVSIEKDRKIHNLISV